MTELRVSIPDPHSLGLEHLEATVGDIIIRSWDAPIEEAMEMLHQSSAMEDYLTKKGVPIGPLQMAERHLERRVGELLGPAEHGGDRKSDQVTRVLLDPISAMERHRLRLIHEQWAVIVGALPCSKAEAIRLAEAARKTEQERPPPDYTVESWALAPNDERHRALEWAGRSPTFNKQEAGHLGRDGTGAGEHPNTPPVYIESIEWARWSWNPVTGCLHNCPYCYARDITERFTNAFPQGFNPAFHPSRLNAPIHTAVPPEAEKDLGWKNVFVCSMADLFGKWVPEEWIRAVLSRVESNPQWNFLFLTKFPVRLALFEFPDNAWVGTTVDCQARVKNAEQSFRRVNAKVKWLSVEPMLEPLHFSDIGAFQWVVIGGASGSTQTPEWHPPRTWSDDLRRAAEDAGCMVYEKTNLLERIRDYPGNARGSERRLPKQLAYIPSIGQMEG